MAESNSSENSSQNNMANPFDQDLTDLPTYWQEMTEQVLLGELKVPFVSVSVPAANFWENAPMETLQEKLDANLIATTQLMESVRTINGNIKTGLGMPRFSLFLRVSSVSLEINTKANSQKVRTFSLLDVGSGRLGRPSWVAKHSGGGQRSQGFPLIGPLL